MANRGHLARLKKGVKAWNRWRKDNPDIKVDLSGAALEFERLRGANLSKANLKAARFYRADLTNANLNSASLERASLEEAKLPGSSLRGASLFGADLDDANLDGADLTQARLLQANLVRASLLGATIKRASLMRANLNGADLSGADLSGADLTSATLVNTNLERANLNCCIVYGVSAWNVKLAGAIQSDLVITASGEPVVQVDNLEVAQFIHLLLNNQKIRSVIDTITSKVVLILGRFTEERKAVLDAIRERLRQRDFLPILFDFEKPTSRSLTETVSMLAHMARFVIADITDAKSIPQELMRIVPSLPTVPIQPLLLESQHSWGMFDDFRSYPWVLEPTLYADQDALLAQLDEKVIAPAQAKARELKEKLESNRLPKIRATLPG